MANNAAAVDALRILVEENYGEVTINISPASIYTGAHGAAIFAVREALNPTTIEAPDGEPEAKQTEDEAALAGGKA